MLFNDAVGGDTSDEEREDMARDEGLYYSAFGYSM